MSASQAECRGFESHSPLMEFNMSIEKAAKRTLQILSALWALLISLQLISKSYRLYRFISRPTSKYEVNPKIVLSLMQKSLVIGILWLIVPIAVIWGLFYLVKGIIDSLKKSTS